MNSTLSARLPHGDPVDWRGPPGSVLQHMNGNDFRPTTPAEESAREAALMRASQMAADFGNVARAAARDTPPRGRSSEPLPPPPTYPPPSRRRHRVLRFVVTIAVGVAATLAWQSYGSAARRLIAARVPELTARVPALAPLIAQLPPGLLTPSDDEAQPTPAATTPVNANPAAIPAPAAPPPLSPEVMQRLDAVTREIAAMRSGMDRLNAVQTQMSGVIARLQADEEARRPPPPPPKPAAKPAARPPSAAAAPAPLPLTSQSTSAAGALPPRRPATAGQ